MSDGQELAQRLAGAGRRRGAQLIDRLVRVAGKVVGEKRCADAARSRIRFFD